MMPLSARFISRSAAGGRLVPWFTRGAIKNVALFFAAICSIVVMQSANAGESYPSRPVRLVVPTGAGGNTDTFARVVAEKLKAPPGQQVIVDNRTGASGIVGSDIVAKAAPDGYTLLMAFPSHPVNPLLYSGDDCQGVDRTGARKTRSVQSWCRR